MFQGINIYLRPIELNDVKYLNKWKNNEETFKFLGGGFSPISVDQQSTWMESMIDLTGNNKRFIICTLEDELPIGMAGIYGINWIHRTAEIGLYIGDHDSRGKGAATESYYLLEKFAVEYLNLRKFKLDVVNNNSNAVKLWVKLGFKNAGKLTDERYINGEYYNLLIMEKFINN